MSDTDIADYSLMKEMRTAACFIIGMWIITYGILSLVGCSCYVTLAHMQIETDKETSEECKADLHETFKEGLCH